MFNETSYPSGLSGLSDAADVQRRLDAGKRVKQVKLDKFGLVAPAPITTMPLPKTPKGPVVGPAPGAGDFVDGGPVTDPTTRLPASDPAADSGGFDLSGITDTLGSIPWYLWAVAAYFLFFRKGR